MVLVLPYRRRGFGLVEIVVGASIISLVVLSVSSFFHKTLEISNKTALAVEANYLLETGMELVQYMRAETWIQYVNAEPVGSLTLATKYYFVWNGGRWGLFDYSVQEGIFERALTVQSVSRSAAGDIVPDWTPGAVYDPNTKEVTVTVEWPAKGGLSSSTVSATTYITNIFQLP